jgi:hypothetical protein
MQTRKSHRSAAVVVVALLAASAGALAGCGPSNQVPDESAASAPPAAEPPASLEMGTGRSVTRFFLTSRGIGRGGDLGGLAGADAHCQSLAEAEGAGDHTWRAYLSTQATGNEPAVNARDRIGAGPWYGSDGLLLAENVEQLHGAMNRIAKDTALTERAGTVTGAGDEPNLHDILTGSRADGTAYDGPEDRTCANWTSSTAGSAQVGHHDRMGQGPDAASWNSAHLTRGCSEADLRSTGGAGLFYCFAID